MAKGNSQKTANGSALDFEVQLWAADKMRGHMDASEYKHVCLGLIFLKYISDAFEEKRKQLLFGFSDPKSEWFIKDEPQRRDAAENRDEYLAANVFWLPPEARWHTINAKAKSPQIGKVIDDAMGAIERENPTLKGVLPRDYAPPSLDKVRLGKNDIDRFKVVVPDQKTLDAYNRAAEPLFKRIVLNKQESRTLAALRAALLPKLLSGELRVADVEEVVHNPERQTV